MLKVAVLVSVGRHPASGRARRAPLDARALELALRLPPDAEICVIHAGDPSQAALRDYLGMGPESMTVLAVESGCILLPLAAHLAALAPDIILAGSRAEGGEDSGMVPYLVAQGLGFGIVSDVAALDIIGDRAALTQALPRGRRRLVETRLPVVAAVNAAAPEPRQSAYARARRGVIDSIAVDAPADTFAELCEIRPWRPRPKRMRMPAGASASDRLKAMTEAKSGEGALLIAPSPEEAARAIYDYLAQKRFIEAASAPEPPLAPRHDR